eukprot:TRINITY_DN7611_c0_g1_i1.p1 TRINITY_DN7611_c0_g1~~TRINITY_DN7611_c0_g1_i1.p1  ORF type:complete len:298 (+),score=3.15 TRINITY_DN7611_c0_g1_i1:96-989(+)
MLIRKMDLRLFLLFSFLPIIFGSNERTTLEYRDYSFCNEFSKSLCANDATTCIASAGSNISSICICTGSYIGCYNDFGCNASSTEIACRNAGCTTQQCAGISPQNTCSSSANPCVGGLITCVTNAEYDPDSICECYGSYAGCRADAGCDASSAISACENSGCSSQLCGDVNTCNPSVATTCVFQFSTCTTNAGQNTSSLCECYELVNTCLLNAGCSDAVTAIAQECVSVGCTAQQCSPVVASTGSSGDDTTSTGGGSTDGVTIVDDGTTSSQDDDGRASHASLLGFSGGLLCFLAVF